MSPQASPEGSLTLDPAVRALVRFAARIAGGDESGMRAAAIECVVAKAPVIWVEELLLQSYLFCGFPRALNSMREWRRISGVAAPARHAETGDQASWRALGETTCAIVYGASYEKLRRNIEVLHPELDEWMIVEGYGKILSRPGLPLKLRELCIVAACVAGGQERQLHSHLHGSLNAGASEEEVGRTLDALEGAVDAGILRSSRMLFARVRGKVGSG